MGFRGRYGSEEGCLCCTWIAKHEWDFKGWKAWSDAARATFGHSEIVWALKATSRQGDYMLLTQYGRPRPKALGRRMQAWTKAAGLSAWPHERKTLGRLLAEHAATTRQIIAILGHDNIAELYTREAEPKQLATDGMRQRTAANLKSIRGGKDTG